jgi:regulator of sigma E protease
MLTVLAFVVALGLLIAVHEYGHYRVAVACGVKVLRFSIGMGKPLFRWRGKNGETEFVIAALPIGGYVRMLDEREGDVPADQLSRAFNRQPLRKRAAIVAAGPAANLLLAVLLYGLVNWMGQEQPQAIIAKPAQATLAERAGLLGGEQILSVQTAGADAAAVESFEALRWALMQAALNGRDVELIWQKAGGSEQGQTYLPLSSLQGSDLDQTALRQIGIEYPWSPAVLGDVLTGMPAEKAGLQPGDRVLQVNDIQITDAPQLRSLIRSAAADPAVQNAMWLIERQDRQLQLPVELDVVEDKGLAIGRVGAMIGSAPAMVLVQKGPIDSLLAGVVKTWDVSVLSLQMMGKMLIGQASLQNLSGPLTIADYAGKSASLGLVQYILFLALISVSLGVLNLLPLPVLDGGHLMYYLWEGVTGRAVSDVWMERLQRGGIGLLLVMMSIALFNDISRIWG